MFLFLGYMTKIINLSAF